MSEATGGGGPRIEVDVLVEADRWSTLPGAVDLVAQAVRAACAGALTEYEIDIDGAEIAVKLTDDDAIRALNRDWRGKDSATNVLSFPTPDVARAGGDPHLGDIAIAYETLAREAEAEGKPLADHLAHLAVHGTLHLLGYDHEAVDDAEEMEAMERRVLAGLAIPDPYAETEPVHP
ncbi:rRNA maturation RNase YbeY [Ancylobacter dichloromethanicus]|uniref:Endoribonuclease YbeY n=1 Tax=Ancylobacter dichloromethanicus TaxID=518825 RepID=A0A9W6JA95_9HYPH|nr:rRNA maturation RNase YbeY [Ancylobacter dichloromethanicus]MBS7552573.1 rRNA maturation RNase YbeY [Ancylobacter dichloromethanicus]GLK71933.1 endoribonuclease YbeY [Ancylobacter dichloromethanicus]